MTDMSGLDACFQLIQFRGMRTSFSVAVNTLTKYRCNVLRDMFSLNDQ